MDDLKLNKEIRSLLNSANQEFSKQITTDKNISNNYINIGNRYLQIIKRLKHTFHLSAEFELYKLAAELGFLQCEVNSFQLCPLKESVIQKNDQQLANFTEQVQRLLKLTDKLENKLDLDTNTDLYHEYHIFKNQIIDYAKNWEKYKYDLKAAFIYNYADFLLSTASETTEQIEKAIVYFQQASAYYANNSRKKEKEETDSKITEARDLLAQVGQEALTSLKVSIPLSLLSQMETRVMQSISIEAKSPLVTGSSKIKTEILPQSSPQSSSTKLKNGKRNYTEQEAKNVFFQPKKSRLKETDNSKNFPYKRLTSGMLLRNKYSS